MNIEGIMQQLPLFSPPIDPGLLVKAAAAGVDLTSALSDVNAPSPLYRFTTLLQKANELCAEVRALGSALLTALEKRDGEALALLRQSQELGLLNAVRSIKAAAVDEAQANLDAQGRARDAISARFTYYSGRPFMNASELSHFANFEASLVAQGQAHEYEILGSALRLLPTLTIGIAGAASSPISTVELGGPAIGGSMSAVASAFNAIAAADSGQAQMAQVLAGYQRRFDDWQFQASLAAIELKQADKSIAAAELRLAMAQKDLDNQDLQTDNAQAIDDFLRSKFTNEDLYDFMVGQISTVYFQSYQLAYEMAKRAQRAFQFELGDASASFIQFGHWDSLRNGLTAGEQLQLDLRRLEIGYLDENRRELEITKHISLATFGPSALVQLRESGTCGFTLPEEIYDYDFPGHYMRRIKSVSLTIPCVVGPYIGVNCTLTLLSDTVRTNPTVQTPYGQNTKQDDSRFRMRFGAVQSIATSGGQSDSGLFELNFHDERYLPFEGAGAISTWRLDLPLETNLFDRETLTDVVLHMRYTARDGGDGLRSQALTDVVRATHRTGVRIFSAQQSFATAWHQFLFPPDSPTDTDQMLALDLGADRLPVLLPGAKIRIEKVDVLLKLSDTPLVQGDDPPSMQYDESLAPLLAAPAPENQPVGPLPLRRDFLFGGLPHATFPDATGFKPARAEGTWLLTFRERDMTTLQDVLWTLSPGGHKRLIPDAIDDLFIIVTFGVA
jgi:hypothetical protein